MPKIWAGNLSEHRDLVFTNLMDAMEGLLAEEPFDTVTMAKIAQAAGIARNTIYNYAPDKDTLLAAATERLSLELLGSVTAVAASASQPAERLADMIGLILRWFAVSPYRRLVLAALFGSMSSTLRARASAPLLELHNQTSLVLDDGVEAGQFRTSSSSDLTQSFLTSVMHAAVVRLSNDPSLLEETEWETRHFILSALLDNLDKDAPDKSSRQKV